MRNWVLELRSAGADREAFESILSALMSDKSMNAALLDGIAAEYTGIKRKTRNRTEALERIRDQFEADIQYLAKRSAIERMTRS
jgi:hypothetical protein